MLPHSATCDDQASPAGPAAIQPDNFPHRSEQTMDDSEKKRPRSPSPPPRAAAPPSGGRPPSPRLSPLRERRRTETVDEISRVTIGETHFYALEAPDARGNQYFHPLNTETGMFSRFPHVSVEEGRPHATDIADGRVSSLDLDWRQRFTEKRLQKKKKPVALGVLDPQGRQLYARDNTAANRFREDPQGRAGLAEPLSPRTARHLADQQAHRLHGAAMGAIESVPLTEELARARTATLAPFPLPAAGPGSPPRLPDQSDRNE